MDTTSHLLKFSEQIFSKSGGHSFLNMYSILTINVILYITLIIFIHRTFEHLDSKIGRG